MIKHVVMWKFQENKEKEMKIFLEKLNELKNIIPEIKMLETGININEKNDYDAILISEFESFEDLDKYSNHPKHKEVGELYKEFRIDRKAIDYEF